MQFKITKFVTVLYCTELHAFRRNHLKKIMFYASICYRKDCFSGINFTTIFKLSGSGICIQIYGYTPAYPLGKGMRQSNKKMENKFSLGSDFDQQTFSVFIFFCNSLLVNSAFIHEKTKYTKQWHTQLTFFKSLQEMDSNLGVGVGSNHSL